MSSAEHAWSILSTGRQGSGKTYRLGAVALELMARDRRRRLVALDLGSAGGPDWPAGPMRGRVRTYVCATAAGAKRGLDAGHRIVIVRPPRGSLAKDERPTAPLASELADISCEASGEVLLCLAEAHLCARNGWPLPSGLIEVAHRARHVGVRVLADTQHPARLHTSLRDECRWYVHATQSPRDNKTILEHARETVGDGCRERIRQAIQTLDERYRARQPGWHIVLDGGDSVLTPRR